MRIPWEKPRQVSVLLHPLSVGREPLLWQDWSRRVHRRACIKLRRQHLEIQIEPALPPSPDLSPPPLSRAQRAHSRLSFPERLARNGRAPGTDTVTIKMFGIPEAFALSLSLATV